MGKNNNIVLSPLCRTALGKHWAEQFWSLTNTTTSHPALAKTQVLGPERPSQLALHHDTINPNSSFAVAAPDRPLSSTITFVRGVAPPFRPLQLSATTLSSRTSARAVPGRHSLAGVHPLFGPTRRAGAKRSERLVRAPAELAELKRPNKLNCFFNTSWRKGVQLAVFRRSQELMKLAVAACIHTLAVFSEVAVYRSSRQANNIKFQHKKLQD